MSLKKGDVTLRWLLNVLYACHFTLSEWHVCQWLSVHSVKDIIPMFLHQSSGLHDLCPKYGTTED